MRRALVLGGTGTVGSAVARALVAEGVTTTISYHQNHERAAALAADLGVATYACDARDAAAVEALVAEAGDADILIHCAGDLDTSAIDALDAARLEASLSLARAGYLALRALVPGWKDGADVVFVGGLDRGQSLPIPVGYAAAQGMLAAMTMALAKELGPRNVRVNMVALGLLDAGLSLGLAEKVREDYLAYSALRRFGTADEVGPSIAWLAVHNRHLNGKVVPLNGGI